MGKTPAQIAVEAAAANKSVGKPAIQLGASGGGNNSNDFGVCTTAAAGLNIFQSQNKAHTVGVGVSSSLCQGKSQGQSWKTKPDNQVTFGWEWRF